MLRALFISIFLISAPVLAKQKDDGSQIQADNFYPRVKIVTSMGDVTLELDRSRAALCRQT